ncbi:MAG: glycosyltransferase family 4 protein, partial [Pseudomonadota bacterium]
LLAQTMKRGHATEALARHRYRTAAAFDARCARRDYRGITHLVAFNGEAVDTVRAARDAGVRTVLDVVIPPSWHDTVADEARRYPGWGTPQANWATASAAPDAIDRNVTALHLADGLLCPSPAVRDELVATYGVASHRTHLVPYAVAPKFFAVLNRPEPGRILFPGTADLRKGIHILAMAAAELISRKPDLTFVIAGDASPIVREHPLCRPFTFLGRISPARMMQEYARADVCVLPSLAEGSAGATYESLAAGVPLVTTPDAGSVARDGIEGRIVPAGDPAALADAIVDIVGNRDRRAALAGAARTRAAAFDWASYGQRIRAAVLGETAPVALSQAEETREAVPA